MSAYFTRDDRGEITLTDAGLAALDLLGLDLSQLSRISDEAATSLWFESRVQLLPEGPRKTFPFLIVPKPSKREKDKGCENMPEKRAPILRKKTLDDTSSGMFNDRETSYRNTHSTVKPLTLMRYLTVLASKPGDTVLDPFAGSGTTPCAAKQLGRNFIGIDMMPEHVVICNARLTAYEFGEKLEGGVTDADETEEADAEETESDQLELAV
jgi:hypothetical protein